MELVTYCCEVCSFTARYKMGKEKREMCKPQRRRLRTVSVCQKHVHNERTFTEEIKQDSNNRRDLLCTNVICTSTAMLNREIASHVTCQYAMGSLMVYN
jgi:hypothetical protein